MSNFTKTKCFNHDRISIAFKVNLDTGEIYWQYAKRNIKDKNDPQFGMYLAKERLKKNPIVVKNYVELHLDNSLFGFIHYDGYHLEFICEYGNYKSYCKIINNLTNSSLSINYKNYCGIIEEDNFIEFHL